MDCAQIRDAFVQGVVLPNEAVQAHLALCPHCHELFEHDAELGRALAAQATAGAAFPEDIFEHIAAGVARETGPRAWLRSRPTGLRFQLLVLAVILLVVAGGLLRHRPDLAEYPLARQVLLLGGYFVLLLLTTRKELAVSARRDDHVSWFLAALALPVLAAFVPATEASRHLGPGGALNCFVYGGLFTVPLAALFWAVDRDDRPTLRSVCLSAAALGLAANLVLELHCPNGNLLHLLLGHASIGAAWLVAWAFTRRGARPSY